MRISEIFAMGGRCRHGGGGGGGGGGCRHGGGCCCECRCCECGGGGGGGGHSRSFRGDRSSDGGGLAGIARILG